MVSSSFDMAIDHFSRAQNAASDLDSAVQTANGLQLFAGAVQESTGSADPYYPMIIDHFWRAQNATTIADCLAQIATGLQQFCAATKNQYS